jgi:hypothetical protein
MNTKRLPAPEVRRELQARYAEDHDVIQVMAALDRSEKLLRRSLYEFGSELRTEIEEFLGEPPLLRK